MTKWWSKDEIARKRPYLKTRAQILKAMRTYFEGEDFTEVETPILQICPVIDTHIRAFATDLRGVDGAVAKTMYLHTSPEFAMKKLMVGGLDKIYQICPVFRNAEGSKRHRPEFMMIEWYRTNADYQDIMKDCEGLLRVCAEAANICEFQYKDHHCNPFEAFERLSVCEAFQQYADIDLAQYLPSLPNPLPMGEREEQSEGEGTYLNAFKNVISKLGIHTAADDAWDDLFFRVMDEKIEPHLGMGRPTVLCDYPISMASLSKPKESDPRFAERFELYICGIELANAFSELTDADEQMRRYKLEMDEKERLYGERYPLDTEFIEALREGLPPSGGIALGIDRLVMLACGAEDISDVNWCDI